MKLQLEFFGPLQDRMGGRSTCIETINAPTTRAGLIDLIAASSEHGEALRGQHIRLAVNDHILLRESALQLKDGDRVAVMSPFSGG